MGYDLNIEYYRKLTDINAGFIIALNLITSSLLEGLNTVCIAKKNPKLPLHTLQNIWLKWKTF